MLFLVVRTRVISGRLYKVNWQCRTS